MIFRLANFNQNLPKWQRYSKLHNASEGVARRSFPPPTGRRRQEKELHAATRFLVVRHPFERIISAYKASTHARVLPIRYTCAVRPHLLMRSSAASTHAQLNLMYKCAVRPHVCIYSSASCTPKNSCTWPQCVGSNATVLTCTWGLSDDYNVLYIVHTLALSDKEYTNIVSNEVH